jgi:two-component system phosphate regulon response regulator PhoB
MPRQKLIVIAEDEADAATLLEFRLQRSGFRTMVASDGLAALNLVFERKPDVLILDLMLPLMHGLEVCRLLKTSPITQNIPILVLTAMASTEDKLRSFGRGADDYLTKPFEMSELVARVYALLRRGGAVSVRPASS